jgi:hypothetical protein
MNALEIAILQALASEGSSKEVNKAYLEFIKANFMIPIEKRRNDEEPRVLFFTEGKQTFLPVFSSRPLLDQWVKEIQNDIDLLELSGVDLLKGIGKDVRISLNIGSSVYKEFNPSEIARMRSMVLKFFS